MKRTLKTCERCGMQFYTETSGHARITTCPECPIIIRRNQSGDARKTRGHHAYDVILELVTIRLAFEMIEPLLKMGRRAEARRAYEETKALLESRDPNATHVYAQTMSALEILGEVEAPARDTTLHYDDEDEDVVIDLHEIVMLEAKNEGRTRGQ